MPVSCNLTVTSPGESKARDAGRGNTTGHSARPPGETLRPMTNPPPKILAKLYKVPVALGDYTLRGTLPGGELIEVVCNQHKGATTDPDFYLLIIPSEDNSSGGEQRRGGTEEVNTVNSARPPGEDSLRNARNESTAGKT